MRLPSLLLYIDIVCDRRLCKARTTWQRVSVCLLTCNGSINKPNGTSRLQIIKSCIIMTQLGRTTHCWLLLTEPSWLMGQSGPPCSSALAETGRALSNVAKSSKLPQLVAMSLGNCVVVHTAGELVAATHKEQMCPQSVTTLNCSGRIVSS